MESKIAITTWPVLDLIRRRWSPRSFTPEIITPEQMNTLLEAATWSFSAGNMQPWHYLYAHRGTQGFDQILECLASGNRVWARNAAVLMITLARRERDPGKPNVWSMHDLGAANMLLILQALSMNIYGHPMGGYDAAKMAESLGIDTSVFALSACIALGFAGDPDLLEESQREREVAPRTRKGLSEISLRI